MTIEDIVALTKAGFSKDEILVLTGDPEQEKKQADPEQEKKPEDPKPEEKKPEDPKPEEKKPADIESINKRLDYLISKINLAAVQKSQQPDEKKETVDDILASIFAKPEKKKEE
ncbi:MAG: hypothetical protein IIZ78_19580 [Clostridiales bacterium]|nr:hypothetical protein [Clostridiales bacterium]